MAEASAEPTRQAKTTMSTVDKALGLLRHFSVEHPEFGLSQLARLSGYDKTTTLRCMTALERNGFVEQHPETRKYRLGFAPLNLARIREQSFPLATVLKPYLDRLAEETGETAHASLLSGSTLMTVAISEPPRATRVWVDPSEPLPLHATASGLAVLAFTPEADRAALGLGERLETFTEHTPDTLAALNEQLEAIARSGIGFCDQTFELEVIGTAVPVFGWSGVPIGAIAVAALASRYDEALAMRIRQALVAAGREVSRQIGGETASEAVSG